MSRENLKIFNLQGFCHGRELITALKISPIQTIFAFSHSPSISLSHGKLRAPSLALDWQIKRLIEVEARVSYHARRWYVHVASAFPLAHHYRAVLAWGP